MDALTKKIKLQEWRKANPEKSRQQSINSNKRNPWTRVYFNAKRRCEDPNHIAYSRYGARGIKVLFTLYDVKFLWFRDKAYNLERPSIDRIDPDGNYEIDNCRFIELYENIIRKRPHQKEQVEWTD